MSSTDEMRKLLDQFEKTVSNQVLNEVITPKQALAIIGHEQTDEAVSPSDVRLKLDKTKAEYRNAVITLARDVVARIDHAISHHSKTVTKKQENNEITIKMPVYIAKEALSVGDDTIGEHFVHMQDINGHTPQPKEVLHEAMIEYYRAGWMVSLSHEGAGKATLNLIAKI
jgi:hypothetical protein